MKLLVNILLSLFFLIFFSYSLSAQSSIKFGPIAKSLAGGGTALVENALWGNMNPGGQVFMGQKVGIGIELNSVSGGFLVAGTPSDVEITDQMPWPLGLNVGNYNADHKLNIVPNFGFNLQIDDKNSIGFTIYAIGNRGVNYDGFVYYSEVIAALGSSPELVNPMGTVSSPTSFDLKQNFAAVTYSRRITQNLGIGISLIGAWQSLSIKGLEAFGTLGYSEYPNKLTNNDVDNSFGFGGKLGIQWNISEKVQTGLSFRTNLVMSTFESYKGFISESGRLDIPSEWSLGVVYEPFKRFQLLLDINRICYSRVSSWSKAMSQNNETTLGGKDGAGFGRKDQMNYKFGIQYKIPKWAFRAGYQSSDLAFSNTEALLNILLPDVVKEFVAFGLSRSLGKQNISFSILRGLENTFQGINSLDKKQLIDLNSDIWNFEIAVEF